MKDETKTWLKYSKENLESAKVLFQSKLFNPCLQNIQQSVEKALKAVLIENEFSLKKTHDILELKVILHKNEIAVDVSDNECDFLNSIYLPSKYPLGSVIPDFEPDEDICLKGLSIVENALNSVSKILKTI